ncbi:PKD domain-containing protein [Streptomyces sp. NPDC001903]|uniref:PKD domain-containing protein n=1 Tax=Streptomyces sp. NPDC001903 TaxID=3364622 RepID=UPI0036B14A1B
MRPTRTTVLLTTGLVTLLGMPAAAAADAPDSLYVSNYQGSNCSDSGTGSPTAPFCTISAAAKAVQPGQTVRIHPGRAYEEAVTIDRSGEPGKPIAFVAGWAEGSPLRVNLSNGKGLTISGASHVVVRGITLGAPLRVGRSADVELDRMTVAAGRDVAGGTGVVVGEGSADVRITRSSLQGVRIDGGSRNTVLARNGIMGGSASALDLADAPGSVVTNNTLRGLCSATLALGGNSTGSAVFNNVLFTSGRSDQCTSDGARNPFLVAQSATAGTRADYNLVAGNAGAEPAYSWSGTAYKDPAAFRAGTGQGAHDILTPSAEGVGTMDGSPTIDSADPTAPGVLPTDFSGKPTADDPRVPNTGRDGGYLDRGAHETQDALNAATMSVDQSWAPAGTKVEVKASSDSKWPTAMSYRVDFGDGTQPVVTRQGDEPQALASHTYAKPGDYVAKVTAVNGVGRTAAAEKPVKVTAADKPLAADFTASPVLPTSDSPEETVRPLTIGLDLRSAVAPWPVTGVQVDFGDGPGGFEPGDYQSPGQHTYDAPGEYKVTAKLQDVKGATSTVSKTVRVDYSASGYVATEPFRIVDTRTYLWSLQGGEPWSSRLPTGGSLSGGMAAAVLNVTVTGASEDTHLSVSPNRQDRPATSNVNVRAGGTSSNTVTVPVGSDGSVWFRLNSGQAKLIVDFVGYYQPNIGQRFSPVTPTRLADTRTAPDGALAGGRTRTVKVAGVGAIPADATAVALNLTSTGATSDTHVIAYPNPSQRPATSNLNPEPGKDKSNQAIVPVGPNGTITLYNNSGSTHLVVDAVGYYGKDGKALFTPVVPKRLGDTRTTGKLAPGATTTVAGLPSGAVGAVLNVTATETSAAGFLTVHGYGTARTDASSLNTLPGLTVPNHVTTPVGDGKVSVFNSWGGSNHVITDLLGYFS